MTQYCDTIKQCVCIWVNEMYFFEMQSVLKIVITIKQYEWSELIILLVVVVVGVEYIVNEKIPKQFVVQILKAEFLLGLHILRE